MTTRLDRRTLIARLALGLSWPGLARAGSSSQRVAAPEGLDLSFLEARHGGRLGVCARDTASGRQIAWRGDERFAYCSTFKLFLAASTLERVQRSEERLDRAIAIRAADIVLVAPIAQPAVGSHLTIERLCQAAVEVSDNSAANLLIHAMGGLEAWRHWYRSIGDTVTRVDRLEPDLNSAEPGDPRDTTTPNQAVANLAAVFRGDHLEAANRALLQGWMFASPTGPARIKAGVPGGYRVAHKTGTGSNGPTNDIGVVFPSGGSPVYIAAYFTEASKATMEQREAVIAFATRQILAAMGHA